MTLENTIVTARNLDLPSNRATFGTFPNGNVAKHKPWPQYDEDEIAAVMQVLQSGRVNSLVHKEQTTAFEKEFANFCGAPYAVATANGTLALELALRSLGIGPGDEVVVPARSFFASVSCIVAVGATPVFADIEIDSQCIDPASVANVITPKTKAVICVHLAGWPCDMDAIAAICDKKGIHIIEDCAQAHGAEYRGKKVGSFGAAAAFSFCTDKIMSTGGEGGMVLLKDQKHWQKAWAYKDHGKNPEKLSAPSGPNAGFRFIHDNFGSNFRLTEMQAAIGRKQIKKLPVWLEQRHHNANILAHELGDINGIVLPKVPSHISHSYYKFYAYLDTEILHMASLPTLLPRFAELGLPISCGSCPNMSREKAFDGDVHAHATPLPNASQLAETSLMFPCDHLMPEQKLIDMADAVRSIMDELLNDPKGKGVFFAHG